MKECHIYDGVALTSFLAELENRILVKKEKLTEFDATEIVILFPILSILFFY